MAVRRLTVNNNKRQSGHGQGLLRGVRSRSLTIIIYLFLAAISVTVFGQTIRYDFVNFDDDLYVYNAPAIQAGLTVKGLALAFTSPHARNWHPLTTISHMLDAYFRYTRARSVTRYLAVAVLFAAGLMSKPMLVSAPVILLLLDYWPLRRFEQLSLTKERAKAAKSGDQWRVTRDLFLEKLPLLVLSAVCCVITFILQKRATGAIPPLPFLWRVQNAFATYVIYAWKTLWPTRLAVFYPHPNDTLAIWEILLAIGLVLAMTIAAIVFRRERPYLFTGWFWYVVMLVTVVGVIQVGEQGHADRYTYLPHIGLFLLAVWLVADVTAAAQLRSRIALTAAVIIIVALTWTAFIQ